jgi:hypothetical protein
MVISSYILKDNSKKRLQQMMNGLESTNFDGDLHHDPGHSTTNFSEVRFGL